ncbi:uncharacterized protein BKA55DRAFT_600252 [Fusarium redolens]|uniref:Uncharacterized protein n=1 Tax=Fusarium redolens TaxID=48865 RepID=A0A9P9FY52_FUSRE|nr:uncharacterized protein BKA55DRAFT_600252 [Fusarium redolens]KAH7205831.1 hypothetical protein BKA55DRAFT_600252 [Fusarium redolens]
MSNSSELLYHIILTVIDFHLDPSGAKRSVYILGTRAALEPAKDLAFRVLHTLKYKPDDFIEYAIHSSHTGTWDHGDGVLIYAKAPAGQVFLVSIQVTPNTERLLADRDGAILLPQGIASLHYVTQTVIDYNKDRTGCVQEMQIEGTFVHRADARKAAWELLDPLDYAEYDTPEKMKGEWPYGEDVLAHAVAETGENTTVEIKTVVDTHYKHGKDV